MLCIFLLLVVIALLSGRASGLGLVFGILLVVPILAFGWILRNRPVALVVDGAGVYLPFAFKEPLRWQDIHRIRREASKTGLYGRRDWLVIDPSPDVLAPLRLPTWKKLELWFQRTHGIRIPLHGLEEDGDDIVASIERFKPVTSETQ